MLWARYTAHVLVCAGSNGVQSDRSTGPPVHVLKGRNSGAFFGDRALTIRPGWPVIASFAPQGPRGLCGVISPRMEMISIMRRRIAVGMLGLAMAGCAQSRSVLPAKAKPVGVEPVPTLSDTINRGMGDPAIQRAALPDPTSPNWSGEFIPPGRGPQAAAPAGRQAAPGAGTQAQASSAAPEVRPSASSPPPGLAVEPAYGAGIPAPAPDSRADHAPAPLVAPVPPVQSVIPEQAAAAEPDTSPSGPSQALPSGTAPAPGGLATRRRARCGRSSGHTVRRDRAGSARGVFRPETPPGSRGGDRSRGPAPRAQSRADAGARCSSSLAGKGRAET